MLFSFDAVMATKMLMMAKRLSQWSVRILDRKLRLSPSILVLEAGLILRKLRLLRTGEIQKYGIEEEFRLTLEIHYHFWVEGPFRTSKRETLARVASQIGRVY
jgi:hypothetical protein